MPCDGLLQTGELGLRLFACRRQFFQFGQPLVGRRQLALDFRSVVGNVGNFDLRLLVAALPFGDQGLANSQLLFQPAGLDALLLEVACQLLQSVQLLAGRGQLRLAFA